jgi:diguanylate cyclase (GGDEF)-like protein
MKYTVELDAVPVAILVVEQGSILDANREACRLLKRDRDWLLGRSARGLFEDADAEMFLLALQGMFDRLAVRLTPELDGTSLEMLFARRADSATVVALRDVTEDNFARRHIEELRDELRHLATHDVLTGLPNRSLLRDRLDLALGRAQRFGYRFAVLFCDLDGFKAINDRHGHDAGDVVLVEAARRLQRVLGDHGGTVARLGGDEFVVICEGALDDAAIGAFAARVIESIVVPIEYGDRRLQVGTSIGIAFPGVGETVDSLLAAADTAMYAAKDRGKGCWEIAPGCRAAA